MTDFPHGAFLRDFLMGAALHLNLYKSMNSDKKPLCVN
ncbi:hypothetical protein X971_0202 [Agrobacterium tumefaciens LBA4213 (Ach5)]|nr:hypothetical protein X971_0202 [Agrobacterium tumefaciens LBA4213 (Ach5)]